MHKTRRTIIAGAAAAGAVAIFRPGTHASKVARRELSRVGRRLHYLEGLVAGANYRLSGRHPDPDVIDTVLADRIRTRLGQLEQELDIPRVHVMVERHVALLHGEVGSEDDASAIERATAAVPGVRGVESYLHVGLFPGDTRPSAGRAVHPPSVALTHLLDAARGAGVDPLMAPVVVRGVLATFADRLPLAQRERIGSHLPADVLPLFAPPRKLAGTRPPRTVHDLVGRIAATTQGLALSDAPKVTAAVVVALRELVPADEANIAAVLPPELRDLWEGAVRA